jgi:hypothetical protein
MLNTKECLIFITLESVLNAVTWKKIHLAKLNGVIFQLNDYTSTLQALAETSETDIFVQGWQFFT